MTFRALLTSDLTDVFGNTTELAVAATLRARGASIGGTAVTVVVGDVQQVYADNGRMQDSVQSRELLLPQPATETALGREPQRGDQIIIASGEAVGTWEVGDHRRDHAAYTCQCHLATPHRAVAYDEEPL